MNFICFKVLEMSKKCKFVGEKKQTKKILMCAVISILLAPPQVATLALSTDISVLTVQFCSS